MLTDPGAIEDILAVENDVVPFDRADVLGVCVKVGDALNVCGLGPESLRELFDTLRVIGPSEVKAKMEALRGLGVQMDMQDRASLN